MGNTRPAPASMASRRAQPMRQTRTNPVRSSARAMAGGPGAARASGGGGSDGLAGSAGAANQVPGFVPALMHFTDSIGALPKELVGQFALLKEVDAKLYGYTDSLRQLTNNALGGTAPGSGKRAAAIPDDPMELDDPLADEDLDAPERKKVSVGEDTTTIITAAGAARPYTAAGPPPAPQQSQPVAESETHQGLFHRIRYALRESLNSLEEKNLVLATANQTLEKQLARCESSYLYIDSEISLEARYGSTSHWAYADSSDSKPSGAAANERPRRDAAAAAHHIGGAAGDESPAASRSESRREAMLAKRSRLQASDTVVNGGTVGRQKAAAHALPNAGTTAAKKGNGSSKAKKTNDAVPNTTVGPSSTGAAAAAAPAAAAAATNNAAASVATAATTNANNNNLNATPQVDGYPNKRRKTEKSGPGRTSAAAGVAQTPVVEGLDGGHAVAAGDARSPRISAAAETSKKGARSGAAAGSSHKKSANSNAGPARPSPAIAASPVNTHVIPLKGTPAGSPPLPPAQPPSTGQDPGPTATNDGASNSGRRRPSTSITHNKAGGSVNGTLAASTAEPPEQAPAPVKQGNSEAKVLSKAASGAPKEPSVENKAGRGNGEAASDPTSTITTSTSTTTSSAAGKAKSGAAAGGSAATATAATAAVDKSIKRGETDAGLPPNAQQNSTPAMRGGGGGRSGSSKTSTPVTANFPEMPARARPSRGGSEQSIKRSHKKGGGGGGGGGSNGNGNGGSGGGGGSGGSYAAQPQQQQQPPPPAPVTPSMPSTTVPARLDDRGGASAVGDDEELEGKVEETKYCYCNQISYGTMVACDSIECVREWFHLSCVGLTRMPRQNESWYCDECKEELKKKVS